MPLAAAAITLSVLGAVGAWLTGSARVAFAVGLDRYAPPAFARIHPRWGTPYVAILVQAALSTVFLLISVMGKGTKVEEAYLVLLDTMLLVYFIPYIYLFVVYLRDGQAAEGGRGQRRWLRSGSTGLSGLARHRLRDGGRLHSAAGHARITCSRSWAARWASFFSAGSLYWQASRTGADQLRKAA